MSVIIRGCTHLTYYSLMNGLLPNEVGLLALSLRWLAVSSCLPPVETVIYST